MSLISLRSLASPQGFYSQPATGPGAPYSSPYRNGCYTELPVYCQAMHSLTAQLLEQINVKLQDYPRVPWASEVGAVSSY